MNNILLIVTTAWLTGTLVTWIRLGRISNDSPGIRFLLALVGWPIFIWKTLW